MNISVVGDSIYGSTFCLEVFNNELYAGGQFTGTGYYNYKENLFKIAKLVKDTSTGVTEIKKKEGLVKIYPNPNNGSLTLLLKNFLPERTNYSLQISDFVGKIYLQKKGTVDSNSSVTVPAQLNLPQGVYLITAKIGADFYTSKFVVLP